MRTVCEINQCAGCMACVNTCKKTAIHMQDSLSAYNAVINESLCIDCGQCETVCPKNHMQPFVEPILWKQGWAVDKAVRKNASSGGLASALAIGFIRMGGVVCSCVLESGEFVFDIISKENEVDRFSGSKYVKSNPNKAYKRIQEYLKNGKKVLFIGLPCQVAGLKAYTKNHKLLYTVDLICHGTPSPVFLKMYLKEKGYDIERMEDLKFRKKAKWYLYNTYTSIEMPPVVDFYTFAFLKGLIYTENCYFCEYADSKRISDITLGDSWGSLLSEAEQAKGISLILCQNQKGKELLSMAEVHLEDVDVEREIAYNKQLNVPSKKYEKRDAFFKAIKKEKNFTKAIAKSCPNIYFRQKLKAILVKVGILSREK